MIKASQDWEGVIDRILEKAARRGDWRKIGRRGERLNLDPPAGVPADQVMANKMLLDNNAAPAWIEDRKLLQTRIEEWRQSLRRRAQAEGSEGVQSERVREEVAELNSSIRDLNIALPIFRLEITLLDTNAEIRRALKG